MRGIWIGDPTYEFHFRYINLSISKIHILMTFHQNNVALNVTSWVCRMPETNLPRLIHKRQDYWFPFEDFRDLRSKTQLKQKTETVFLWICILNHQMDYIQSYLLHRPSLRYRIQREKIHYTFFLFLFFSKLQVTAQMTFSNVILR